MPLLKLRRESLEAPAFAIFSPGASLEILATIEELETAPVGKPFPMEVCLGAIESSFKIRFSLNSLPMKVDEDIWRINFHTNILDQDRVRYAQFILDFTRPKRPVEDDGHGRAYRQLFCQNVPEIFFSRT